MGNFTMYPERAHLGDLKSMSPVADPEGWGICVLILQDTRYLFQLNNSGTPDFTPFAEFMISPIHYICIIYY